MIGLKVPKQNADKIRRMLLKSSAIDLDWKIKRHGEFVFIPLVEIPKAQLMDLIGEEVCCNLELVETEFEAQRREPKSFTDYLKGKIDPEKMDEIKKSFDIIGDVVILEIPEDLEDERYLIGDAALKFTGRKAIFRKKSEIKGIIRTRELEHLAGEDSSETVHREFGCRFMLDMRKVYFSPRLATERRRIGDQVVDGETILDMFAGVAPFSIAIAKRHNVTIYAIDINEDAYYYMMRNVEINKLKGEVKPFLGDVEKVLGYLNVEADRIIMNLPGTAWQFLPQAVKALKPGGTLHYYEFASDYDTPIERIIETAYPRKVEVLGKRKVKSKSPGVWHMGIDARIF